MGAIGKEALYDPKPQKSSRLMGIRVLGFGSIFEYYGSTRARLGCGPATKHPKSLLPSQAPARVLDLPFSSVTSMPFDSEVV